MAGGVPRAKIIMPLMNRVFKGVGDRHMSSEEFWNSELGRLCAMNFDDVTAHTFDHLIDLSAALRRRIEASGGSVRFQAYGYHGTEVIISGEYQWQSYAPYVQGWAKRKLEDIARAAWERGTLATVYNCPEILTNSSSIFVGVEVPLYPMLEALFRETAQKGRPSKKIASVLERAKAVLKPGQTFAEVQALTDKTLSSPEIRAQSVFCFMAAATPRRKWKP